MFLGSFSTPTPTLSEITEFLSLTDIQAPSKGLPYTWSNTVTSLDGVIKYSLKVSDLVKNGNSSKADFKLLQAGWSFADAVLFSGESLRREADLDGLIIFEDLMEHRRSTLKKPNPPLRLILTSSSELLPHTIFKTATCDAPIYIITTAKGKNTLRLSGGDMQNVHVLIFKCDEKGLINLEEVLRYLKVDLKINYIDASAGGKTLQELRKQQLLNEIRFTLSAIIVGVDGDNRCMAFPSGESYGVEESVGVAWRNIRTFAKDLVFFRGVYNYPNENVLNEVG